ncbi:MAG: hypothetical protein ABI267_07765, partial [Ginsengibacter sp.]
MKNIKTFVAVFIVAFLINACSYPCGQAAANFALVNFTDAQTDSIILRRFIKPGNYSTLKDSFVISRSGNANFNRRHDTLLVLYSLANEGASFGSINSDYDYEIYLPAVNRLYKLSNVEQKIQHEIGGGKRYCINPI